MKMNEERETVNFDRDVANFQPRQREALKHLDSRSIKFLLYGGALGGGKSYFLRWLAVRFLIKVFKRYKLEWCQVMLACEDYPSLKDRQLTKVAREFPSWLGKSHADHKEYSRCFILGPEYGNGVICFRNLDDASKYQSAEFAAILVDELTKNDYETFTFLRTRLRWPGLKDVECPFVGGTNPGGIGHGWTKQLWMDKIYPDEFLKPVDYSSQFAYVPSKADDNPFLDESYWAMLNTLPLHIRKAFKDGDWNIFVGQAFQEWSTPMHVIDPIPIPDYAPIYMTFDWGFGKPFSVGWWWVDSEGRLYRFNEWYGWNGSPNEGLRLPDSDIREEIMRKESEMDINVKSIRARYAGPDCFSKKPDYKGGGQGPSTAEVFANHGKGIFLTVGDPSRELKIRQFRERLKVPKDNEGKVNGVPMMQIYSNCTHFVRTVPSMVFSKNKPEDIDTDTEDHCFDPKTEVLTDSGWKKFYDLNKSELIATLNQSGDVEYNKPYKYIENDFNGNLFQYDGRVSFAVTGKHRFPVITKYHQRLKDGVWSHKFIDQLTDDWWLPRTNNGKWVTNTDIKISMSKPNRNGNANNIENLRLKDFMRYYGFWLAEGCKCYQSPTHWAVHVDQKGDLCEEIVAALGYRYNKHTNNSNCTRYTIQSQQFYEFISSMAGGSVCYDKFIPRWMFRTPQGHLKALYDGMMIGDGSMNRNMPVYNTTSRQLADDFQELLFHLGMVGNIKKYEQKHTKILGRTIKSKVPYYRVHILRNQNAMIVKGKTEKKKYNGKVYCLRVKNETLYVRRNGTPYWSSNCYDEACHICMARPMRLEDPKPLKTMAELRIEYLEKGTPEDQFHRKMAKEQAGYDQQFQRIMEQRFGPRVERVADFETKDTVD